MTDYNPIETQIFEWNGWDELDFMALQFYDCTLKIDIGPYKVGDKISNIAMMFDTSTIAFYDEYGNETFLGKIKISVVPNE
jgi:hypothetical protein